jgi:hypothetical protein
MADKAKMFGGLTFRIDRPKGYVKEWPQEGWTKRFTYPVDYGYLPRHVGEDEEGLDFFVGDDPGGHLESFQKLKRDDYGRRLLDETKFLVGVTDSERETIYRLYGDEVWHRKVYKDMDELAQDLPKFKAGKKARYVEKKAEHTHKWTYLYLPGDCWRYCDCDAVEEVDPDGKHRSVDKNTQAYVLRKARSEKKANGDMWDYYRTHRRELKAKRKEEEAKVKGEKEKTAHTHRMATIPDEATYVRCLDCGLVKSAELYGVLEKTAINFGNLRNSVSGLVQRLHGPQPTMLPPMKTPNWHAGLHPELQKYYHANRAPNSTMVELMARRAGELGYHDLAKAQTMGDLRDGLTRLGVSPAQQYQESMQAASAPQHREKAQAYARANPQALDGQSTFHARQNWGASSPKVAAKLAVLARYGFKRADAKFADIDKQIMGEIEITGPHPADWAFSRLTGPQHREGAETSSSPGIHGE